MVTGLTLAGLATALVVLYLNLRPWWAGKREAKQLAAFGKGASLGVVSAVCPGGLLGWAHAHTGTAANAGGNRLAGATTGIHPAAPVAGRSLTGLNENGAVVAVLILVAVILAWRAAGKDDRKRTVGGAFVASAFCLTAGVVGMLTWVPGALNGVGASVAHAVSVAL